MKRILSLIALLMLLPAPRIWATPIDSIFANLHISELSLLTKNDRLDLLDYANCGQEASVENLCLGRTKLTQKSPTYLHLSMTEVHDVALLLLPHLAHDTIVCVISTLHHPLEQSAVRFYTLNGQLLTTPPCVPMIDDFLGTGKQAPTGVLLPIKMVYDDAHHTLLCELSLKHLPREIQEKYADKFPKLTYRWSETGFMREE